LKRAITVLVAGTILLGASAPIATAENRQKERIEREMRTDCQFEFVHDAHWTDWEERLTARCLVRKWSVPGGLPQLASVISCESGWWRFARNPSGYVGLGQHDAGAWPSRVRSWAPAHWDLNPYWANSRSNLTVTVRMAHADGHWGQWSGCA
jgi:hypothetical protein